MKNLYDVTMTVNGTLMGNVNGVDELELFELTHSNAAVDEIIWNVAHGCDEYIYRGYDPEGNHVTYAAHESTSMTVA